MWEGLKNTIGKTWNNPYVSGFRNYAQQGGLWAGGFEPTYAGHSSDFIGPLKADQFRGGVRWQGYNAQMRRTPGQFVPDMMGPKAGPGMGMRIGMSSLGFAFSAYNIYSGYQEGGIWGAKDSAVWEIATASAAARFAYGSVGTAGPSRNIGAMARMGQLGIKTPGTKIVFGGGGGMVAGMARVAGAGIGASIGQEIAGTPGAFIGGFIGAAPIRFAATHPLLAGGMALAGVTAAAGAAVVKGGTAILREGHQHRQRQRGIDTSGSMAAFMTQNAMTMRSRAVQAMHKSHLNARSALGQEAGFMHMPSKNYHSRYR